MPVGRLRANKLPKKAIAHYGALNPIIFTEVNSGNPRAIKLAAKLMHY